MKYSKWLFISMITRCCSLNWTCKIVRPVLLFETFSITYCFKFTHNLYTYSAVLHPTLSQALSFPSVSGVSEDFWTGHWRQHKERDVRLPGGCISGNRSVMIIAIFQSFLHFQLPTWIYNAYINLCSEMHKKQARVFCWKTLQVNEGKWKHICTC